MTAGGLAYVFKPLSEEDAISSSSISKTGDTIIGNMKIMAEYIKETTGGDKFSLKTESLYSQDYDVTTDQAKKEQQDNARPKLISQVENMEEYDIMIDSLGIMKSL